MKGENIPEPGIPESFKVLIKEMQSLGLDVKVLTEDNEEIEIKEAPEVEGLSAIEDIIDSDTEVADEEEIFEDGGFSEEDPETDDLEDSVEAPLYDSDERL